MENPPSVFSSKDPEKAVNEESIEGVNVLSESSASESNDVLPIRVPEKLSRWNRTIESFKGLEARGISRVPPDERVAPSHLGYVNMALLWYSANITANNLAVGFLGPLLFGLGFVDSSLCVVFACFLGSLGPAYMAIWGPQSGNRTMVKAFKLRCALMN